MAKTVVGLIENFNEAQAAVRDLAAAGFSREHIGFVANEGTGTGAVAGGLIGGLAKLGVPEQEAHTYAEGVRRGGTLVTATAHMDQMADRAVDILKRHGAVDIDERATTWRKAGWSGRVGDEEDTIPVLREEVAIGKRRVPKGAAKVYSHVTERPHRPATAADQAALNERVYEMHDPEEEPVIEVKRTAGERWDGTERRMASGTPYAGIERRKLT